MLHRLLKANPFKLVVCSQVTIANTISLAQYVATLEGMELGKNIGFHTSLNKVDIPQHGLMYQTIKTTTV